MANTANNTSTTAIIRDLEFYWANLQRPHAPFGTEQWDVQVRTDNKDTVKELESLGVKMKKNDEGVFFANIKRKTKKANGEPMDPVKVVDAARNELKNSIGNGSKGHVKLFSYEWNVAGRSGRSAMLSAVQVTDLIEYNGKTGVDFDDESGASTEEF